jgi:two-component system response regulator DesR
VIRTLLAMHRGLLRGALRYVLSTHDDIDVVAEWDNLEDALASVRVERPDVTVLDLEVIGGSGSATAKDVRARMPGCKVLVLVDPRRSNLVQTELADGAPDVGFLAQTVTPDRLVDCIRRLAQDQPVLDADLVVAALRAKGPLTVKERRVLEAAAEGAPVKEIAARLALSPGTVRNHLSRIIAKTGARTRIEAIHIARDRGWL